jgi:hypothetical protein
MVSITESDLVTLIRQRCDAAIGGQPDAVNARQKAFDQFMGKATGTEVPGRPTIQSMDVNSMITAVSAQMAVSFSTDTIATFSGTGQQDEQAAQAESQAVNKIIVEDNGGFRQILGGVQGALLYRTGYMKVYWQDNRERRLLRMNDIKPADLPILGESEPGIERRVAAYNPKTGVASVEVTKIKKRLCVRPVNINRFFYDLDWDEAQIAECPLTGEVEYKSRDQLLREGVPPALVKELQAEKRNAGIEASLQQQTFGNADPIGKQMELIRTYDVYVRMALDGDDGYAYLYHCEIPAIGPAEFLQEPELCPMVPYACGTAFPIVGQHDGEALSDKLRYVQDGKTELYRQWIENVRSCSYGRYGVVSGQANEEDVKNPVGGKPIRIKRADAIFPIPIVDAGASIKMALEEYDKMRTEMGGAAIDMIGAEMQLAQDTAHGTERVYASKELLVSYMTRNLAESLVRGVYLLTHATLRTGEGGPVDVKVQDEWQQVDPTQWPERTYCNVKVGYSMGERMQISQALLQAIGLAKEALANGLEGVLVTKQGLYRMVLDFLTMQLVTNADQYFVDPASPSAIQAGEQAQQAAKDAALENARQQAEALAAPERVKAASDKYKTDSDLEFKYFNAILDNSTKQAESDTKGVIDLATARTQANAARTANAASIGGSGSGNNGSNTSGSGNRPKGKKPNGGNSGKQA